MIAHDLVEADADAAASRRQVEELAELPVPAHQAQVLVEHRDALAGVVERRLQDVAVVLDRRGGVVEELERGLGSTVRLRSSSDSTSREEAAPIAGGEQMLGVAQQLDVGLALGIEAEPPRRAKLAKDASRALLAEIAGDRRVSSSTVDGRAPQPEARRHRARGSAGTKVSPAAVRSRPARRQARTPTIGDDIDGEAPGDAVRERRQVEPEQRLRPQRVDAERAVRQKVA